MSETERLIDSIHTSCKDCVFAVYENKTQTDCSMGMIKKYRDKNDEIIEAYDDDKEFYIINKRKCINHRKESWFAQFENPENSTEYRIEKTKASNRLNYILLIDLKLFNVEKLHQTFIDISNLDVKPKRIILLRYSYANRVFDFDTIKGFIDQYKIDCPWRVQTMVEQDVELRSILSSTINLHKQHRFMTYMTDYTSDLNKIINRGNEIAFDNLEIFSLITDKLKTTSLFSGLVYRYLWFIEGKDILITDNETIII
jgi:hypothetical protein